MKNSNLLLCCLLMVNVAYAQTHRIYVKASATGANTGQSWADAYTNLQSGCQIALAGDTIWVAEGIYYPDTSGNRFISFEPQSGVRIFGGFNGSEIYLSQRNWVAHPTVLSGDIGVSVDSFDNSYNVMYLDQPDSNTVIDGLVFRDGVANYESGANTSYSRFICGGGLYVMADGTSAYPEIRNCKFSHNTALYYGGGIMVNGANNGSVGPRFIGCIFDSNRAGEDGGGLAKFGSSKISRRDAIDSCIFIQNFAGLRGGGWYHNDSDGKDTIDIENSSLKENHAGIAGGGAFVSLGRSGEYRVKAKKVDFNANTSNEGAALDLFTNGDLFVGVISLDSCSFVYNKSITGQLSSASILYTDLLGTPQSKIEIAGSLFKQNTVGDGSILYSGLTDGNLTIENTTFVKNVSLGLLNIGSFNYV
jgi:hypothetical protein